MSIAQKSWKEQPATPWNLIPSSPKERGIKLYVISPPAYILHSSHLLDITLNHRKHLDKISQISQMGIKTITKAGMCNFRLCIKSPLLARFWVHPSKHGKYLGSSSYYLESFHWKSGYKSNVDERTWWYITEKYRSEEVGCLAELDVFFKSDSFFRSS